MKIFHLHLTPPDERQFITGSGGNLPRVITSSRGHEKNKFQGSVIRNKTWFILECHHSTKWRVSRDDVPQKVKQ
jgi:hypothetical protein